MRYDLHLRLAHELGKHLHELIGWNGPITHRQFIVWQLWLEEQKNVPSRDNYYQMQVACEMRRMFNKNPNNVKVENFRLEFGNKQKPKSIQDAGQTTKEMFESVPKQQTNQLKNIFIGFMSAPVTRRVGGEVVEVIEPPFVRRKKILEQVEKRKKEAKQNRKQNLPEKNNKDKSNERRTNGRTGRKGG